MQLVSAFLTISVAVAGVSASPSIDIHKVSGLSADNSYGAPHPPWASEAKPGWYLGSKPHLHPEVPCLDGDVCDFLDLLPVGWLHCPNGHGHNHHHNHHHHEPPTSNGYSQTFHNLTGATQAPGYLTFGLVDTITDCEAMCNSVTGCQFVNTYHDVNGKGGSTQLTCSLFSTCHNATDATNLGGQTQPDGSVNYITDSDGYCKV